jgi:cytochrome aa3-600 menaquinol oxidase subunit 1
MLAVVPADYQYHNSYFMISHFHNVLIGGTVFGCLAGLTYWWPKMFGHKLDERLGKWAFWLFNIGFYLCFLPMYLVGLQGMTRRIYTYPAETGWGPINFVITIGAFVMGIGFVVFCYNIYYSARYGERDMTGDPWNGRTLEWSVSSPAPHYNFAHIPEVAELDAWWHMKKQKDKKKEKMKPYEPIHMPNNTGMPVVLAAFMFVAGFGFVFEWYLIAIIGLIGVVLCMLWRSFNDYDSHHYVSVEEIKKHEIAS